MSGVKRNRIEQMGRRSVMAEGKTRLVIKDTHVYTAKEVVSALIKNKDAPIGIYTENLSEEEFAWTCVEAFSKKNDHLERLLEDARFDPERTVERLSSEGYKRRVGMRKLFGWAVEAAPAAKSTKWLRAIVEFGKKNGKRPAPEALRQILRKITESAELEDSGETLDYLLSEGLNVRQSMDKLWPREESRPPLVFLAAALVSPNENIRNGARKIARLFVENDKERALGRDERKETQGVVADLMSTLCTRNINQESEPYRIEAIRFAIDLGFDPAATYEKSDYVGGFIRKTRTNVPLFNMLCETMAYADSKEALETIRLATDLFPMKIRDSEGRSALSELVSHTQKSSVKGEWVSKMAGILLSKGFSTSDAHPKPSLREIVKNEKVLSLLTAYEERENLLADVSNEDLKEALSLIKEKKAESGTKRRPRI